jgi:hypothetical protein
MSPNARFCPSLPHGFAPVASRALVRYFRTASTFCALTKTGVLGAMAIATLSRFYSPPLPPRGDEAATALGRASRFLLPTPGAGWQKKSKKENPPAYIPLRPKGTRGAQKSAPPTPKGWRRTSAVSRDGDIFFCEKNIPLAPRP